MSRDLLQALRVTCDEGEERVGAVFVKFGPRLRTTYGAYCRNHDNASSLVEKVRGMRTERENESEVWVC